MDIDAMIKTILDGKVDESLQEISNTINLRDKMIRHERASKMVSEIKVGDRVRIMNIVPRYLNGVIVKVIEKRGLRLRIRFAKDDMVAGKYAGTTARVPASAVEKVK